MSKPEHVETRCLKCGAEAQSLITTFEQLFWCVNGHITFLDATREGGDKLHDLFTVGKRKVS